MTYILRVRFKSIVTFSDIANPLIGDIAEYERFIYAHTDKQIREPADHIKNLEIVPYRPPEVE